MIRKILNIFILLSIIILPNLYAESSSDEEVITFPKMIVPDPGIRIPDELVFIGRFLDKETKKPIPNIKLEILAGKTKLINGATDSNGRYEIAVPIRKFSIDVFKSITKGDITFKFFFWGKEVASFHLKSPPKIEDIINSENTKHGFNWRFQNKNEYRPKNNIVKVNVYNSLTSVSRLSKTDSSLFYFQTFFSDYNLSGSLASWIIAKAASNLTRSKISLGDKYITWYGKSLIKVKVLIIAKIKTPDGLRYMNENDGQWWGCYKIMSGSKMGAQDCLESKKEHYLDYENILLQKTKLNQLVPGSLANLDIIDSLEKNLLSESKSSAEIGFWILSEKYSVSQVWKEKIGVEDSSQRDDPNWWENEDGKETEKGNVAVFVFENEIPGSEIEYKERLEVGQVFADNFQIISKSGEVFYT